MLIMQEQNKNYLFYYQSQIIFILKNYPSLADLIDILAQSLIIVYIKQSNRMNQSYLNGQNQIKPYKQQYSSAQILQIMKKKPFSHYSILKKKQQTFFFTNNRFLYLKGIQSISYARQFPENQSLPFTNVVQIPKPKTTFPISDIEKITNDQEILVIYFSGEKKVKWQFACPSKVCALQWRKRLDYVIQEFISFSQSGFSKYEDFLKNKEMLENQKYNQFNLVNKLLQSDVKSVHTNQPSIELHINNQQIINSNQSLPNSNQNIQIPQMKEKKIAEQKTIQKINTNKHNQESIILGLKEESKVINPVQFKHQQSSIILTPKSLQQLQPIKQISPYDHLPRQLQKSSNRPKAVLFKGPQMIEKVQNFIVENNPQPQFLTRSIASIPTEQKQSIKNQIIKLRRNWIKKIIEGQDEVQLIIDFRNYANKIGEVIINELYIEKSMRMFPPHYQQKKYASYLLEDVEVQVYFYSESDLNFYPEGGVVQKNPKYKNTVIQFKNLDYFIGQTKNEGILKVPLMMLFEYKGFLGMVKSRIIDATIVKNKEVFELVNIKDFQADTKISSDILLNQKQCRIVCEKPTSFSKKNHNSTPQVYFIEKLVEFLPTQQARYNQKLLRPEFIQDEALDDSIFRDQQKQIKLQKVHQLIYQKIQQLVEVLENYQDYFTNSKELSEIVHSFGLNIRHLGLIYKKVKRNWLKKIIQAEIIARCAKKFFRLDIQNSVLQPLEKSIKRQRQHQRERNRVTSFLNIVFGSNQVTLRMWRNFNHTAQSLYNTKIWETQFTNINIPYLLQAIQTNFKIILGNHIHQKDFFSDMDTFQPEDFQRFQFDSTYYNLDFTQVFDQIHECLQQQTIQSFHKLCDTLISQSDSGVPYFNLLQNHPIHDSISEFLLQFTSPQQNQELYNRIQQRNLPSRFMYQSKLAEIKWLLKAGKHEKITKAINFIEEHARKWLGKIHPIFTTLNRILAQYYSQQQNSLHLAIKYANTSLQMQRLLFEGDCQQIWKDYLLVGKIHYISNNLEQSLQYLTKAKELVNMQNLADYQIYGELHFILSKCFLRAKYFKESYSVIRQFYNIIKAERDQKSLVYIVQCVELIKYLLELNQQHESYYHFIQSDFSFILQFFVNSQALMKRAVKMITVPYLKHTILKNTKNRNKIFNIINQLSKISNNSNASYTYLKLKTKEGVFPKNYFNCLKQIDNLIQQIQVNQMIERWLSFNKMANQALLDKIGGSQITKGFQFLANITAILHLLGSEALDQLFVMQK